MPAVSTSTSLRSPTSSGMSIASRVVPATSETITRSSPRKRFTSEDLPTFGRPITARRIVSVSGFDLALREQLHDAVEQVARAEPLGGRDGHRVTEPEAVEVGGEREVGDAVALVGRDDRGQRRAAQQVGHLLVPGPDAGFGVDDEHRDLRVGDPGPRLIADRARERVLVLEVHAAGVDEREACGRSTRSRAPCGRA